MKSVGQWILIGAITFLMVEVVLTVFDPVLFKGFYEYDSDLGFKVRGHFLGTNQFGFNDRDHSLEPEPGTKRIVILGDSFNWTGEHDCSYPGQVGRLFRDEKKEIEVLNVGYPGTGTPEEFVILKKYGMQYQPRVVVLAFYLGNDFSDSDPKMKRIIVNGTFIHVARDDEWTVFGYPILFRSRFLEVIRQRREILANMENVNRVDSTIYMPDTECTKEPPAISEVVYLQNAKEKLWLLDRRSKGIEPMKNHVDETIHAMNEYLGKRKIEFRVVIIPDELQVDSQVRRFALEATNTDEKDIDLFASRRWIVDILNRENIPYLDLTDVFATSTKLNFAPRSTHFNVEGTRLAAIKIHEWLSKDLDRSMSLSSQR